MIRRYDGPGISGVGGIPIASIGGKGQNAARSYATVLYKDYGAAEVWPLVDIAAGVTIPAFVNSDRDGTLQGWDLQNAAGPVTGTLAPFSDGANDYGNVFSDVGATGLKQIFDSTVGTVFMWLKAANVGVWTDGANRFGVELNADASNRIALYKPNVNNTIAGAHEAGGVWRVRSKNPFSDTAWFSLAVSWNKPSDEVKFVVNGVQEGATLNGLGVWAGALSAAIIGAVSTTPTLVWNGWLAYVAIKFGSVWSPADCLAMHNAAATAEAD